MEINLGAGPYEVDKQNMSWTALWNPDSWQSQNRGVEGKIRASDPMAVMGSSETWAPYIIQSILQVGGIFDIICILVKA